MAVFFLFLRNVLLPIEILKIKILEHSDPPSQHFFVHKAFSHSFLCRRKVVLCHLAEWHTYLVRAYLSFLLMYFSKLRVTISNLPHNERIFCLSIDSFLLLLLRIYVQIFSRFMYHIFVFNINYSR